MSSDSLSVQPPWGKQIGSIIGRLETSGVQITIIVGRR